MTRKYRERIYENGISVVPVNTFLYFGAVCGAEEALACLDCSYIHFCSGRGYAGGVELHFEVHARERQFFYLDIGERGIVGGGLRPLLFLCCE